MSESSEQQTIDPKTLHKYIECDNCGKNNPSHRCSRCRLVFYCNRECQKSHYKTHKPDCKPIDAMRAQLHGFQEKITQEDDKTAAMEPVNVECGICLQEPMVDTVVLPGCRHGFCFSCLSTWQGYSNSANCPFCRQSIDRPVDEEALEKASLLTARSRSKQKSSKEKEELLQLALAEVEKVLFFRPDDLLALTLKGQILMDVDPQQAVQAFEAALRADKLGCQNRIHVSELFSQREEAERSRDVETVQRIDEELEELISKNVSLKQFGDGPARLFDIKIFIAEAWEASLEWGKARDCYKQMLESMDCPEMASPPQTRKIFSGLSRCLYHLGDYNRALHAAEAALSMNRHFPGVHKLVALPFLAKGNLDEAKQFMSRAILYEAPWDDDTLHDNMKFLMDLNTGRIEPTPSESCKKSASAKWSS